MHPADHPPIPSRAAIAGHPIHPMLIPFPIAFLIGALLSDLLFVTSTDGFWAQVSYYLLFAGLAMGLLAAFFGFIDFAGRSPIRRLKAAWIHFLGNVAVLILTAFNLGLRLDDPLEPVLPHGLVLSVLTSALLVVTGWMGGEMVYRHRVGVSSS